MKDLCARFDIPSADYQCFDEPDAAKAYIHARGAPIVVKADGLAAGKGVVLCRNEIEAHAAVDHIMSERAFGAAGDSLVSRSPGRRGGQFLCPGRWRTGVAPGLRQDHKAAFDGDKGPNTGGMGAYSPAPVITAELAETVMERIVTPTIKGMAALDRPYKGVLYAGLMITDDGPKLLEYTVRFGDPECQPLVLRLKSDLLDVLVACAEDGSAKPPSNGTTTLRSPWSWPPRAIPGLMRRAPRSRGWTR